MYGEERPWFADAFQMTSTEAQRLAQALQERDQEAVAAVADAALEAAGELKASVVRLLREVGWSRDQTDDFLAGIRTPSTRPRLCHGRTS